MTDSAAVKLHDLWDLAVRNKWVILGAIVVSLSVAYVSFRMSPKIYKSSTTILVESQKIPQDYVRGVVAGSVLEMVRKKIEIKTVGRGSVDGFTISFLHESPMTAMKVAAKLASQYIEENLKVREQLVEGA